MEGERGHGDTAALPAKSAATDQAEGHLSQPTMDSLTRRLLVIGADAAGMSAASQARRRLGPDDLHIVAFDRANFSSYSACAIPYLVSGVLRHEVLEVDLDRGVALVDHRESGHQRYPGAEPVTVKLVVERGTGRLLGAQIVGRAGAATRIDALAVAVWNEMTVHDLLGVDLSYARRTPRSGIRWWRPPPGGRPTVCRRRVGGRSTIWAPPPVPRTKLRAQKTTAPL